MWTMVGGGIKKFADSFKPMSQVLPQKADWIQDKMISFDPEHSKVTTAEGHEISYEFLVVAMGLQLNYHKIPGLIEALETPLSGVCSNYSPLYVSKTHQAIKNFKQGNAIFTFPNTPVKCAGAPQKIMYITERYFQEVGYPTIKFS